MTLSVTRPQSFHGPEKYQNQKMHEPVIFTGPQNATGSITCSITRYLAILLSDARHAPQSIAPRPHA